MTDNTTDNTATHTQKVIFGNICHNTCGKCNDPQKPNYCSECGRYLKGNMAPVPAYPSYPIYPVYPSYPYIGPDWTYRPWTTRY